MNECFRFVTLSKYPPYRSGHAKQALWNNTALSVLTEAEQHQVTYCGSSADPADDPGPGVRVHHVQEIHGNRRVPDGHLLRAVTAELYRVAREHGVDVINTYYLDPHAAIANRVADALSLTGRRPVVMHSIEGSDVLESVCEHLADGSAWPLLADVMRADVLCTVSHYTAQRFLAGAEAVGGALLADTLAESVVLRYPGLPPAAFAPPAPDELRAFRQRAGLRPDSVLISTLGRLAEEKGLDTLLAVADIAATARPGLEFVIAGAGGLGDQLAAQARNRPNLTVLRDISSADAQCLRAASAAGVFPTRVIPGFIETFCVAALEYEALGVPVLASAIGGVPEAVADPGFLVDPGTSPAQWLARIDQTLLDRAERGAVAAAYAARFTSARSAQRMIDLATLAAGRLNRSVPLKAAPVDDYLAAWPARAARPGQPAAEPAQM